MEYLLVGVGLALLILGADRLVGAAGELAHRAGMSRLAIGIVVVGLGTSMPELVTSLDAALQGSPDLAIGNVVGSNIANILLVLGLTALCRPFSCDPLPMRRELLSLLLACALALFALLQGTIDRWLGLALTLGLAVHLAVLFASSPPQAPPARALGASAPAAPGIAGGVVRSVLWIAVLLAGAHLLVSGALGISHRHGVPESVIGLSLVAIGTSLPELAVAGLALVRRSAEVAIGNIIGSTLFNLLGVLGITALASPLTVPDTIARFDIWIMLAAVLALVAFTRTGWRLTRVEGAALLVGYPVYLAALSP